MSKVIPLHPYPALSIDGKWNAKRHKYIVISDLHIGFESELYLKGITMDSRLSVEDMVKDVNNLVESYKADGIVILGDLKNTIGSISKQEWDRIPYFFKSLSGCPSIYIVPGNHDSNIGFLAPKSVNIISTSGLVLDDTLLIHGHTMPSSVSSNIKRIIMGHMHPVFIKNRSTLSGQRVWIYLKVKKEAVWRANTGILDIIVVPSFNKYLFGMAERGYRKSICPLINRILKSDAAKTAMALTLDGSLVADRETLQNVAM
jgi:putative SbcD/Mre11-related phosphoesterase